MKKVNVHDEHTMLVIAEHKVGKHRVQTSSSRAKVGSSQAEIIDSRIETFDSQAETSIVQTKNLSNKK